MGDNLSTGLPIHNEFESLNQLNESDSDNSSNGDADFYEKDNDSDGEEHPTYNITNVKMTKMICPICSNMKRVIT